MANDASRGKSRVGERLKGRSPNNCRLLPLLLQQEALPRGLHGPQATYELLHGGLTLRAAITAHSR